MKTSSPSFLLQAQESPQILDHFDGVLIIHKPAHYLSHPKKPGDGPSILAWLQQQFPHQPISLINRLDRETSGILLASHQSETASLLGKKMMKKEFFKDYLTIVFGSLQQDYGKIDAPIGRLGLNESNPIWLKRGICPDGDPSVTEYWSLAQSAQASFVHVRPWTGRAHQIRVHLASLGHPLIGDKLYGTRSSFYLEFIEQGWTSSMAQKLLLPRQALHSFQLSFEWKGQFKTWQAPLPQDMSTFLSEHNLQRSFSLHPREMLTPPSLVEEKSQ